MKSKALKLTLKSILYAILALVLVVVIYLGYVFFSYSRIEDNLPLSPTSTAQGGEKVKVGTDYVVVTQNVGFGAYTPDFTFFMDGGKESRAKSKESVEHALTDAYQTLSSTIPDFVLLQEVDTKATRSYGINQLEFFNLYFEAYQSVYAENYHSAYLFYPFLKPHGASKSGLVTYSGYTVTSAVRKSIPVSTSLSKFLDLDRCYSKSVVGVENGKNLVMYNVHMSAYGGSEEIRTAQMSALFNDMKAEYDKGNYCIAGGDFNHDFTGDSNEKLNGNKNSDFEWAQPFPENLLPQGITRCTNYTDETLTPTARNCDIPYKKGNYTIIVDGFLVSDNVDVSVTTNIQTDFSYSDHNPVAIVFKLK